MLFSKARKKESGLLGLGRYMFRKFKPGDLIMCTSRIDYSQKLGIVTKEVRPGIYMLYFGNDDWDMTIWDKRAMSLINEAR